MSEEFESWSMAWADIIAKEPTRSCRCGGTMSRHSMWCPYAPPHGYDAAGKPFQESQLGKAFENLGRSMAQAAMEKVLSSFETAVAPTEVYEQVVCHKNLDRDEAECAKAKAIAAISGKLHSLLADNGCTSVLCDRRDTNYTTTFRLTYVKR